MLTWVKAYPPPTVRPAAQRRTTSGLATAQSISFRTKCASPGVVIARFEVRRAATEGGVPTCLVGAALRGGPRPLVVLPVVGEDHVPEGVGQGVGADRPGDERG